MLQGCRKRAIRRDMDAKMYQADVVLPWSLWRNGIARWTSNPEAPGSSPGRDGPAECNLANDVFGFFSPTDM